MNSLCVIWFLISLYPSLTQHGTIIAILCCGLVGQICVLLTVDMLEPSWSCNQKRRRHVPYSNCVFRMEISSLLLGSEWYCFVLLLFFSFSVFATSLFSRFLFPCHTQYTHVDWMRHGIHMESVSRHTKVIRCKDGEFTFRHSAIIEC